MSGVPSPPHVSTVTTWHAAFTAGETPLGGVAPTPLTSFVGRQVETETVVALLRQPNVRLLTLTGAGGIGKTRLAIRVIESVRNDFADGIAFVPLAAIRSSDLVLPAVIQALRVPDDTSQSAIVRLQTFLARRQMLLVLDNFEHLLAAAPLLVDLFLASPRLKVLCTCRGRLGISGEHLLRVKSLPREPARALFEERVRALVPAFRVTSNVRPTVDQICARLDGLPLAIELAAARSDLLSPRSLLARLERRLELLNEGPRDVPVRLRTMRDAIGWSHDLLHDQEQVLFRRLGLFNGGFTLDAAQAVAGEASPVLAQIQALVAVSLIEPVDETGAEPRFAMLETIREYALERLAACGEREVIGRRHAEFYCWLAESALPYYDGPELPRYNDLVDRDLANCRAALAWTLRTSAAETGVRLAGALWRVWWYGKVAGGEPWLERVAEGRGWIEQTLSMSPGLPVEAVTEALSGAGFLAHLQRDFDRARAAGEELLARAEAEGYGYGIFWAHHVLGRLIEDRGPEHDDGPEPTGDRSVARAPDDLARPHYEAALVVAPLIRNPDNHRSMSLLELGSIAMRTGDLLQAETLLGQALGLCRQSGNPFVLAGTLVALGQVLRRSKRDDQASAVLKEAFVVFVSQRDLAGARAALVELALLALARRRSDGAVHLLAAAETLPGHRGYRRAFDDAVAQTRQALPSSTFDAGWDTGTHLTWEELLGTIENVIRSASVPEPVFESRITPPFGLSPREIEVLGLVSQGQSNRDIAESLSLSSRTVETHVLHIMTKLNVGSRTAAATVAVQRGLVRAPQHGQ